MANDPAQVQRSTCQTSGVLSFLGLGAGVVLGLRGLQRKDVGGIGKEYNTNCCAALHSHMYATLNSHTYAARISQREVSTWMFAMRAGLT